LSTPATLRISHPNPASHRKSILLVFGCTILGTVAQLLMKTGMDPNHYKPELMALITNVPLVAGYTLYGINTIMLVLALREGELSVLYPILALTYIWVTLLSYIRLHEPPNIYKNLGVMAIIAGVIVIGRGGRK